MGREKRVASRIRTLEQLFQIQCFSHPTFGILIGRVTENAYLAAFSEVSNLSKVARVGPFGVHGYGFRMGWEKRVASRARNGAVCFFNSSFFPRPPSLGFGPNEFQGWLLLPPTFAIPTLQPRGYGAN